MGHQGQVSEEAPMCPCRRVPMQPQSPEPDLARLQWQRVLNPDVRAVWALFSPYNGIRRAHGCGAPDTQSPPLWLHILEAAVRLLFPY